MRPSRKTGLYIGHFKIKKTIKIVDNSLRRKKKKNDILNFKNIEQVIYWKKKNQNQLKFTGQCISLLKINSSLIELSQLISRILLFIIISHMNYQIIHQSRIYYHHVYSWKFHFYTRLNAKNEVVGKCHIHSFVIHIKLYTYIKMRKYGWIRVEYEGWRSIEILFSWKKPFTKSLGRLSWESWKLHKVSSRKANRGWHRHRKVAREKVKGMAG